MTEYEPETVAVATVRGVPNVRVMRVHHPDLSLGVWVSAPAIHGIHRFHPDKYVTNIRPLIVLDPEVCGGGPYFLGNIITELRGAASVARHKLADMIEQQTKPPKPAEPTGLGAVVEDAEGRKWVRDVNDRWWCAYREPNTTRRHFGDWSDVPAVRVLSEGVQP